MSLLPKFSYLESCKSAKIENGRLYGELKDTRGNTNIDYVVNPSPSLSAIDNIDGYFRTDVTFIPKKIFQTHKSEQFVESNPDLKNAVETWKKHQEFEYNFYDNEACERFMFENFEEKVYEAYQKCPLPVMKADLWRYCIIFKYGGIYADVDTICNVNDPSVFLKNPAQLVISPENDNFHLCQWFFCAPEGSPILKSVIDLSVEMVLKEDYKEFDIHFVHKLTGPGVFTKGIEMYLSENSLPTFSERTKYFNYPHDFIYCFEPKFFHKNTVKHLFAGEQKEGWKDQRKGFYFDRVIKNGQ